MCAIPQVKVRYGRPRSRRYFEWIVRLSAGIDRYMFTTGDRTAYGLAEVPVIEVAMRSDLARRWHDLIDINVGMYLFQFMLDVASGRKKTCAGQWKLNNALVLFNPAPVT